MSLTGQDLVALFRKHPVGISCGLAAFVLAGASYYRMDLIPAAEALLEQRTSEGEKLNNNLKNSVLLKEQQDALVAANREVGDRVIRMGALTTNLQYFYRIEAETETKLLDVRQQAPTPVKGPAPKYLRVPYSLSVQGSYAKVITFLRKLETGSQFVRVTSATLNPVPTGEPGTVTLSLSLEVLGMP
jgi:Tfp pilus assembly protein PilO